MGGKGKGKSTPPPPPSGEEGARLKADLEQRKLEQAKREKREALEAIAAAKEHEAKRRDLEARLPTLRGHDIATVPWDQFLLGTHLVGGKGGQASGGVDVVELPGSTAVCVRRGPTLGTEILADALAALLDVRVARMRLVGPYCDENKRIPNSFWRTAKDKEKDKKGIERYMENMDPETRARLQKWKDNIAACAVLEFIPGQPLDVALTSMDSPGEELLHGLGQLCALDLLMNNYDRVPLPCWGNKGNLTNAMVTAEGIVVGIDQQINVIGDGPGLDSYLTQVRDMTQQVCQRNAPAVAASIRDSISQCCHLKLSAADLDQVNAGMRRVLLKAVEEHARGALLENLTNAAKRAQALLINPNDPQNPNDPHDYSGLAAFVHRVVESVSAGAAYESESSSYV